jgi:hypothetical protein
MKIADGDPVDVDRPIYGYVEISIAIDTRGIYMDFMTSPN